MSIKKRTLIIYALLVLIAIFSSGAMGQDAGEIDLNSLAGPYDLGWIQPNSAPNSREIQVVFPESFASDFCQVEMNAEYEFGEWDCLEGAFVPPPAVMYLRIDHPSEEYGYWAASFQPTDGSGTLPPAADFVFHGNIEHSWSDLARQEVAVSFSFTAFTWPECELIEDFFCTVNNLTLIYNNPVATTVHAWGALKSSYR